MRGGEYVVASRRELTAGSITDDWVEAFTKTMEEARCLPIRTQAIMEVVLEEEMSTGSRGSFLLTRRIKERPDLAIFKILDLPTRDIQADTDTGHHGGGSGGGGGLF